MKKALVTITCGKNFQMMAKITHPFMRNYAKRIEADFIVLDAQANHKYPYYLKFDIQEKLFDKGYDRIIYADTDVIIKKNAPNLFTIVPEECLALYPSGHFSLRTRKFLLDFIDKYNIELNKRNSPPIKIPDDWNGKYYNTGVFVISKECNLFSNKPIVEIRTSENMYEEDFMNYLIMKNKYMMYDLPIVYNYPYDFNVPRLFDDSFFIHYMGRDKTIMEKVKLMIDDVKNIYTK